MRHLLAIWIVLVLLTPVLAHAKRGPKPKVDPIVYGGVQYSAHGDGRRGYVQASDPATKRLLWEVTVFRTWYNPLALLGETDVLDVFIKSMSLDNGTLIVVAEDGRAFSLDLKSRKVKRLKEIPKPKPHANQPAAGNAGIARWFAFGHQYSGVPELTSEVVRQRFWQDFFEWI